MRVISVGQRKGGVGKTTLAINLACEVAQSGLSVTVLDCDPQGSALEWSEAKNLQISVRGEAFNARNPIIWMRNVLKTQADIVILDLPAGLGPTFETALMMADLLLIPCAPSDLDISAAKHTLSKVKDVQRLDPAWSAKIALVPTRVFRDSEEGGEIVEVLAELGTVAPTVHHDLAFVRAFSAGAPVQSIAPGSAADEDIRRLGIFALAKLNISRDFT